MPLTDRFKKRHKNPSDGSTELRETGNSDEMTQAEQSILSGPAESAQTAERATERTAEQAAGQAAGQAAEQQVNSVEADARSAVPQSNAIVQTRAAPETRAAAETRVPESPDRHGPFAGRYPVCKIVINHDHHGEGRGEDAPPLWRPGLVGAFDGLGGAGGELVRLKGGTEQTGAWLASRTVAGQVAEVYKRNVEQSTVPRLADDTDPYGVPGPMPEPFNEFDFTAEIRRVIQKKLDSYAQAIRAGGGGSSRIRSKLIKTLPTTLAVCTYDLNKNEFTAIWAGDSRVFYLRPQIGLLQVTTDDLRTHADALKNLTEDSPMSNYVSAEAEFVLHERRHELQPFSILFAATDGCFGYVQTPLHFEHLLLSTMREASGWADWERRLEAGIVRVTSDDSTLAAAIIGWRDFGECRERFRERADWCEARVRAYNDVHERVGRLEHELDQAKRDLAETTSTMWDAYRRSYEMPVDTPTRDVPDRQQAEPAGRDEPEPAGADPSRGADRP